jgi:micrococcal nuclease
MNRPPPDIEIIDLEPDARGVYGRSPEPDSGRAGRGLTWLSGFLAGVLAGMVIGSALPARADSIPGPSIHIIDGDTVRLPGRNGAAGEIIRIWNIDAPETARARCEAEAALGRRATARLGQLLRAGPVAVVMDEPAGRREDRYGRTLARLTIAGRDIGEIMIRDGLATRWPQRRDWCGRG